MAEITPWSADAKPHDESKPLPNYPAGIKKKKYMIHVRWKGDANYHVTNWGNDDADVALSRAREIMGVIERDKIGRHAPYAGQKRFSGCKIIDHEGKMIYFEEQP